MLRRPFEPRQFTSDDFTGTLKRHGVMISMDGKGRCMDNIFVERLWRSLKYEEVYLHAYATIAEARAGIGAWLGFAHIPTGTATNHGFDIDEVNGRLVKPAVASTAIGADIETGRVTP